MKQGDNTMENNQRENSPMHQYLTTMEKYTRELPFYADDIYSLEDAQELRSIFDHGKSLEPVFYRPNEQHEEDPTPAGRFRPKNITHMSRQLIEFQMPKHIEEKIDKVVKPLYNGDIALCHYNYIEYNLDFSEGKNNPMLPPHIDADENLITVNTNFGSNIVWDLIVDGKTYSLAPGQTIIFSAVNQIHWRPQRNWKEGEFLEILSLDYCPVTNYRFTGLTNPIDPVKNGEARANYSKTLNEREDFQKAWKQYNEDATRDGVVPPTTGY